MTYEQKKERVKNFCPINDVFFEVVADDTEVCQEILRTILEDDALTVEDVIVQKSIRNIYGRSVRLDALCVLGNGTRCNIEVQRSNDDDHFRRARYNAASITARESEPGDRFENVPTVIVVYISEKDFLAKGRTIYHIDKVIRETKDVIDDGLQEVFVNASVNDGTKIAELMQCFMQTEVNNPQFPKLSTRVKYLKEDEGGLTIMCELMEQYLKEARQEGEQKGRQEVIQTMLQNDFDKETILKLGFSEAEYNEAEQTLLVHS